MPEKEVFYPMHPPPPAGLSLNFPSAFATFHLPQAPIPVNQRTDDGRYIYGIHSAVSSGAFHPPTSSAHGILGSPTAKVDKEQEITTTGPVVHVVNIHMHISSQQPDEPDSKKDPTRLTKPNTKLLTRTLFRGFIRVHTSPARTGLLSH
ncbi:hypothetical protein M8J76_006732 [Diaphorina citri]|nr:hypothetical protein M8J76_006732 [Diaphorina citri]